MRNMDTAEGKFNGWELGKLMKSTQVLEHHYKQPTDVLYQVALDKDQVKCRELYFH